MPRIYLSPSTQEKNLYVTGNTEEYYMNRLADELQPFLRSSGIQYTRNTPQMTAGSSIRASNAGNYDLHLALHSNASPEGRYGELRGTDAYYDQRSSSGRRAAEQLATGIKEIYPLPDRVRARTTTSLGEVTQTKAPSVLLEVAYHDNVDDANWITGNLKPIARNIAQSLTRYFGIPFAQPITPRTGRVATVSDPLNIRSKPNTSAPVIARAPKGSLLTVVGRLPQGWDVVEYDGRVGYAATDFIDEL